MRDYDGLCFNITRFLDRIRSPEAQKGDESAEKTHGFGNRLTQ